MFKIYKGGEHFYQWDLGQRLEVEDAAITKVHFCNGLNDCSYVCDVFTLGGKRLVEVPNILLQTTNRVRVYGCIAEDADTHFAKDMEIFRVIPKNKPDEYVYTEEEIKNYTTIEDRIIAIEEDIDYLEELGLDTLESRVDNIAANANSTEGNSELVDIRVGADGTTYPTAGTAVRTQINLLNTRTNNLIDTTVAHETKIMQLEATYEQMEEIVDALGNNTITVGEYVPYDYSSNITTLTYINYEGEYKESSACNAVAIPCSTGEQYAITYHGTSVSTPVVFIGDANKKGVQLVIELNTDIVKEEEFLFTVNANDAAYLIFNYVASYNRPDLKKYETTTIPVEEEVEVEDIKPNVIEVRDIRNGADGTVYATAGDAVRAQVTNVNTAISTLGESINGAVTITESNNILNLDDYASGYMNTSGNISESSSLAYSTKPLPVAEGDVIRFYRNDDGEFRQHAVGRFVTAFSNGVVVSSSGAQSVDTYTVPSGIDSIVITIDAIRCQMITKNYEATYYEEYFAPRKELKSELLPKATETTFGVCRIWVTSDENGNNVLNISTED